MAQLEQQNKDSYVRRFVGNAQFDYKFKFLDGLRANLNLGLDFSTTTGWNITNQYSEISYPQQDGEWLRTLGEIHSEA